jgi:hypothetical protein
MKRYRQPTFRLAVSFMTLDGLNALQLEYNLRLITLCLPLVVAFFC